MELFEINAGSFIGVASATPLRPKKLIRAIDAVTKVVPMLAGEVLQIGGGCDSVTSEALKECILS